MTETLYGAVRQCTPAELADLRASATHHPTGNPRIWQFSEIQVGDMVTYEGGTLAAKRAPGAARTQAHRVRAATGRSFRLSLYRNYLTGDITIVRTA
jgi:hypothetical protein